MKKFFVLFLLALLAVPVGTSRAGVVNSPHDIAAQGYAVLGKEEEKRNVCNFCHVPHKAKGARLWANSPPSLKDWGDVGPLCYSCHDGVSIVSPYVDASNTAFNPKSHGLNISDLPTGDDASKSGLPYTTGEAHNMECSTCHNPHDDTQRPFLRVNISEICLKCHVNRENSGYGVDNVNTGDGEGSTHPVHIAPEDAAGGASPITVQDEFKVSFPEPYPSEGGKNVQNVHWTLGGHLSEGEKGNVECITCHAIHGREKVGPPPDGLLLAVDPVKNNSDEFCEGCHRGKRGDNLGAPPYPNPGGTELPRTYHPADNDISNGQGRLVDITQPSGWTFGKGGEVLCTTCHKAHSTPDSGGKHTNIKNSPILRRPVTSATFCEECHNVPFPHHPSGDQTMQLGAGVNSSNPRAKTRQPQIPADFPAGITYGTPVAGKIYCSSCHKAHNATCTPILATDACGCDICVKCHYKFNPTWQTDDNYKSSHFIGDPTLAVIDKVDVNGTVFGTQNGYSDQYPPQFADVWPESNLKSLYGGTTGKDVTCCSCHSFAVGNITAGDADQSPYLGPVLAPEAQVTDLTTGLLARAGAYKEWLDSDVFKYQVGGARGSEDRVTKYLCTGCHGLNPNTHPDAGGEGLTHPLMDADGNKFAPDDTAKLTYNKHVNCESCHSPHEADSRGGFFILRTVDLRMAGSTTVSAIPDPYALKQRVQIEYAPLCQKCHKGY